MSVAVAENHREEGGELGGEPLEDDVRLVRRIRDGDQAAFEELVRRTWPRVAHIAGRFFREADAIDEIAQEVFVKAFVALGSWEARVPLQHWLSRIAVNACYDELRRRKRTAAPASREPAPEPAGDPRLWEREETRIWAAEVLARLPAAERLVLTLTVLEDLSVAEVAELTGWSKVNVKVRAFRARRKLKQLLAEAPGVGPGTHEGRVT
jgi:RNA polymerase sigma-70 factor (ECF subfamily)